jgi:hypothetical protein
VIRADAATIAIGWTIVLLLVVALSHCAFAADPIVLTSNGVTCADVKKLTLVERKYWIWRLGLTSRQVAAIKAACRIK